MTLRWLIVVSVLVANAHSARADGPPVANEADARKADAQRYLDQALAASKRGDYVAALADLQRAYALFPSPKLRFNIAVILGDLGRDVEALEAYEAFLDEERAAPEEKRAQARAKVEALSQRIGRLLVRCPAPEGSVSVDGKSLGTSPLVRTVRLVPGPHQISAERATYLPFLQNVSVAPGALTEVSVQFRRSETKSIAKRWWFWTSLAGAAVVAAGIGVGVAYGRPASPTGPIALPNQPSMQTQ